MFKDILKSEIKKIEVGEENYPLLLKKIPNSPKILYCRGEIKKDEACLAIVGTRRYSRYGKENAFSLAKHLAMAGITIVSGLARGIDTFAHLGALEAGGRTIAVLGTGLDEKSIYPKENLKLAKKILEKGSCLLSEYPTGTPGWKENFPQRNRIISGLSLGVLVIEAKLKSGALITAKWAKIQERKLFALPGSIYSLNSNGPHFLIKKGAKLVENANDILAELKLKPFEKKEIKGKNPEQSLILKILQNGSLTIDEIIEKTNFPSQKVSTILTLMEIEDKVKNLGGNIYVIS